MSWSKVFAVIRREYLERVRTKAFWFATFLVPVFFLGYMFVQVAALRKTSGERKIAVVDVTGRLAKPLSQDDLGRLKIICFQRSSRVLQAHLRA